MTVVFPSIVRSALDLMMCTTPAVAGALLTVDGLGQPSINQPNADGWLTESVMVSDFAFQCGSPQHLGWLSWAVPSAVVYVGGIILWIIQAANPWQRRLGCTKFRRLRRMCFPRNLARHRAIYGFLYLSYVRSCWYWRVVHVVAVLVLTGGVMGLRVRGGVSTSWLCNHPDVFAGGAQGA